jgi:hypothetical protein
MECGSRSDDAENKDWSAHPDSEIIKVEAETRYVRK